MSNSTLWQIAVFILLILYAFLFYIERKENQRHIKNKESRELARLNFEYRLLLEKESR